MSENHSQKDPSKIHFRNRYTGGVEEERIFGGSGLRLVYGTLLGRLLFLPIVRRRWFSRWTGRWMSRPESVRKIAPFVRRYGLDASEWIEPPSGFPHFNAFFHRKLHPGARPIDPDPRAVVFPADGRHLLVTDIDATNRLYAKGQHFDLPTLIGSAEAAKPFRGGSAVISRLCPVDYHRFHFAADGEAGSPRLLPGPLVSVSPLALRRRIEWLFQNRRMVTAVEHPEIGRFLQVEIGATCVGSIEQTFCIPGNQSTTVTKGDEKGYFAFGGSCVVTIFPAGIVRFEQDIAESSSRGLELYAHVGDRLGTLA